MAISMVIALLVDAAGRVPDGVPGSVAAHGLDAVALHAQGVAAQEVVAPLVVERVQVDVDQVVGVELVALGVAGADAGRVGVEALQAEVDVVLVVEDTHRRSSPGRGCSRPVRSRTAGPAAAPAARPPRPACRRRRSWPRGAGYPPARVSAQCPRNRAGPGAAGTGTGIETNAVVLHSEPCAPSRFPAGRHDAGNTLYPSYVIGTVAVCFPGTTI